MQYTNSDVRTRKCESATAIDALLADAIDYIGRWEHELSFRRPHQRYWGWVYRLLLAGDDDHIVATLLDQQV